MKTLPLDPKAWDLVLDGSGDLVLTDDDYSIAQDVASAVRTFLGEPWYNTNLGMPYFQTILGQNPPASLVSAKIKGQAFTIMGVTSAKTIALRLSDRLLTGTIVVTSTSTNAPIVVNF